jgi:hypothetical protein
VAWNDSTAGYGSTDNVWTLLSGTYDGGVLRIYGNGAEKASLAKSMTVPQNNNSLEFGINFNGIIDEVRAEYVTRSASWLQACYTNQVSPATFATYGALAPVPRQGTMISFF